MTSVNIAKPEPRTNSPKEFSRANTLSRYIGMKKRAK